MTLRFTQMLSLHQSLAAAQSPADKEALQRQIAATDNKIDRLVYALVQAFGFRLSRTSGSHHIYVHPAVTELVNLQNVAGQAKPYQVRQFLRIVERYNLTLGDPT